MTVLGTQAIHCYVASQILLESTLGRRIGKQLDDFRMLLTYFPAVGFNYGRNLSSVCKPNLSLQ